MPDHIQSAGTHMQLDALQQQVIDQIEQGNSMLLCGRAGTGKSFTLQNWAASTAKSHVLLAPTGVAAVHLQGQTIHSFFCITPGALPHEISDQLARLHKSRKNLIKAVQTIVIDEVSMVRADLLDCVDICLRLITRSELPFGGKQLVLAGDLYQLPPVVQGQEQEILARSHASPYFFSAQAFMAGFRPCLINLRQPYRQQQDMRFLELLNAIRNCSISTAQLDLLNAQVNQEPWGKGVFLTGTNRRATTINQKRLGELDTSEEVFCASHWGKVDIRTMPVDEEIRLKQGAQVMITRNDQPHLGRWVNGTTGKVADFFTHTQEDGTQQRGVVVRKQQDGQTVKILPCSWEVYRYLLRNNRIERELVGAYTQVPLRLAWALTIHKSQGKTFRRITLDPGDSGFAHGQIYVALSRATSLAGIRLTSPLTRRHILLDAQITRFMAEYQRQQARLEQSETALRQQIDQAVAAKALLAIDYLRRSDAPQRLVIQPLELFDFTHKGNQHQCLRATEEDGGEHHFNLARVLYAEQLDNS